MLTDATDNDLAVTTCRIYDIGEATPIPKAAVVSLLDFDPYADDNGLWIVEWEGRVYLATPDELKP